MGDEEEALSVFVEKKKNKQQTRIEIKVAIVYNKIYKKVNFITNMATNLLLYKLRIFSLNDVMHSLSLSESATKASLCRWQQQGIIKMIRRNMYVAIDPTSDTPLADKYESASNISSDSYVGWHTARSFMGLHIKHSSTHTLVAKPVSRILYLMISIIPFVTLQYLLQKTMVFAGH